MSRVYLSAWESASLAWLHPLVLVTVLSCVKILLFAVLFQSALSMLQNSAETLCRNTNLLWNDAMLAQARMESVTRAVVDLLMIYVVALVKQFAKIVLSVAKALISFAVELYLGTITCLCTALIKGAIELLTDVLLAVTERVEKAVNAVLTDFNATMNGLSDVINTILLGVNAVKNLFSGSDLSTELTTAVQKVNLTVSSLKEVSIPTAYIDKISSFSDEIPDFESVLSNVTSLLTFPLLKLAQELDTMPTKFNRNFSSKAVSDSDAYLPLCSVIDHCFDEAAALVHSTVKCIIIALSVAAFLLASAFVAIAYARGTKRDRLFNALAQETDLSSVGNQIEEYELGVMSTLLRPWSNTQKWFFAFSSVRNIVNCLSIGLVGFATIGLQFLILKLAKNKLRQMQKSTQDSDLVSSQAASFFRNVQGSVDSLIQFINDALFSLVKRTSAELLQNMQTFQSKTNTTLSSVFDGTPFASPIRAIVYCTVGRKIEDVEDGLSWIVTQLNIPSPQIQPALQNALSLSSLTESDNSLSHAVDSLGQRVYQTFERVEKQFLQIFKTELIICSVFTGIWLLYVVGGMIVCYVRLRAQRATNYQPEISWPKRIEGLQKPSEYPHLDLLPSTPSSMYSIRRYQIGVQSK
ncbi:hypothetical protein METBISCDRAFT_28209 [Metschnikowia bicuspidata]|uniref:Plasma membrane fusion protein PRM1 n=1 Tax=Metschnikowia bicuspidata TaxID=27322 RepID=A0A4P9Z9M6_9ASCO|nr:hypothetical protein METBISCDRAFT_28209 [Metschnikowia bicuspidata]